MRRCAPSCHILTALALRMRKREISRRLGHFDVFDPEFAAIAERLREIHRGLVWPVRPRVPAEKETVCH